MADRNRIGQDRRKYYSKWACLATRYDGGRSSAGLQETEDYIYATISISPPMNPAIQREKPVRAYRRQKFTLKPS
jgi:hypothetical protein